MNSARSSASNYDDDNFRFDTGLGPMTDRLLNTVLDRATSGDFREKLMDKIVEPITHIINRKIKPYVYISIALYLVVILLLVIIIYLLVKKKSLY